MPRTLKMNKELSMYSQMLKAYDARTEEFEGVEHIIVPVVMMVEGVHAGSRGPLLHLATEFGHVPAAYNGIPVTIQHPQIGDNYVSANSPQVLADWSVGKIFNATLDDNKLKAEAWLNSLKLQALSAETLLSVQNGAVMEVSIGIYSDEEETPGQWNGEQYNAVARNHKPDHLALLPGAVGACSVKDGCGIRVNSSLIKKGEKNVDVNVALQTLRDQGFKAPEITDNSDQGLNEKLEQLRNLVRAANPSPQVDGNYEWNYLVEAYDGYLIYEKETSGQPCKYYKRNYQFNVKDDVAEFTSDPVEVIKKTEFKPVQTNIQIVRTKFNSNKEKEIEIMSDQKCTPCVKAKVDKLIQANTFCEDDRTYLESLAETRLDSFLGTPPAEEVSVNVQVVTKEVALNTLKNSLTSEEALALLPADMQATVTAGLALHAAQKESAVQHILANAKEGTWTAEELNALPTATISKIAGGITANASQETFEPLFTLNATGNFQSTPQANAKGASEVAPMAPAGVIIK